MAYGPLPYIGAMAYSTPPPIEDIIIQGMQEGGQYQVTTAQSAYLDFRRYQWPTIKAEIWNACRTDKLLEGLSSRVLLAGTTDIDEPPDFDAEIFIDLYSGPAEYRGIAQAATATTMTLAPSFIGDDSLKGLRIFTLTGPGSQGQRTITEYNNTTKLVTVDAPWASTPAGGTAYLIGQRRHRLSRVDYEYPLAQAGLPRTYSRRNWQIELSPAADQHYPLLICYRQNLTLMDELSSQFSTHLLRYRHLWVQGVKVKTMAKYDDDRFASEKQIWEQMLAQYAAKNRIFRELEGHR